MNELETWKFLLQIWTNAKQRTFVGAYRDSEYQAPGICLSLMRMVRKNLISFALFHTMIDKIDKVQGYKTDSCFKWPLDECGKNQRVAFIQEQIQKGETS